MTTSATTTPVDRELLERFRLHPHTIFSLRPLTDPTVQRALGRYRLGINRLYLGDLVPCDRADVFATLAAACFPVVSDSQLSDAPDPRAFLTIDPMPGSVWCEPAAPLIAAGSTFYAPRGPNGEWIEVDAVGEASAARADVTRRVDAEIARRSRRRRAVDDTVATLEARAFARSIAEARASIERDVVGAILALQIRAGMRSEDGSLVEVDTNEPRAVLPSRVREAEQYVARFGLGIESTAAVVAVWRQSGASLVAELGAHPLAQTIRTLHVEAFERRYRAGDFLFGAALVTHVEIDGVRHAVHRMPFGDVAIPVPLTTSTSNPDA